MNSNRKNSIEVTSDPMTAELIAIKDRLSAIETIQSITNHEIVAKYVEAHLRTKDGKLVMKECEQPRTRKHLMAHFKYGSAAALDYHLKPLRDADLIRQSVAEGGTQTFEWSNLFRRLPKSSITKILSDAK